MVPCLPPHIFTFFAGSGERRRSEGVDTYAYETHSREGSKRFETVLWRRADIIDGGARRSGFGGVAMQKRLVAEARVRISKSEMPWIVLVGKLAGRHPHRRFTVIKGDQSRMV
jgi:hypothetical protein